MPTLLWLVAFAAAGFGVVWWLMGAWEAGARRRAPGGESPERPRTAQDTEAARPRSWHEVLGVAETASNDEIRAAYRRLVSQYHPDKVATLGEDLRALAEVKTREINTAYDYIRSWRGLP